MWDNRYNNDVSIAKTITNNDVKMCYKGCTNDDSMGGNDLEAFAAYQHTRLDGH